MYLAKIIFPSKKKIEKSVLEELANLYLSSIGSNGQIIQDSSSIAWVNGNLTSFIDVSHPDALAEKNHNEWSLKLLNDLLEKTGAPPKLNLLDDDIPKRFPRWSNSSFLVLFAENFTYEHPIRRGNDGFPFPSYQLPLDQIEKSNLYGWLSHYRSHANIWLESGILEMESYKQLADPTSEFGEASRDHCKEIEKCTGIPTYYFLFVHWGRKKTEYNRLCPLCGKSWNLKKPYINDTIHWAIHFKCDKCRIVSEPACSFDDERHARIGEYKKRQ